MSWIKFFSTSKANQAPAASQKKFGWKQLFKFSEINAAFYEQLEEKLLDADVGAQTAVELLEKFRLEVAARRVKDKTAAVLLLKELISAYFVKKPFGFSEPARRVKLLTLIGVNGAGKTTTLAKLAHLFKQQPMVNQLLLGAADTFRAAAVEQLSVWGERLEVPVVKKAAGADAAAVAYETLQKAVALADKISKENQQCVVCLLDTAGRLHNKAPLLEQLAKLVRVTNKFSAAVEEKRLLVLDATLGQNGYEQAKIFNEKIGVDGIILTKTDNEARGGVVLAISKAFALPLYFISHGEALTALSPFDLEEYLASFL